MSSRPYSHRLPAQPDFFARLTPWLVAACLTAGMGWLVKSADDSHVHVTSKGVERHQHGHLGAHSHNSSGGSDSDHFHESGADHREDSGHESDSEGSESESGFLSAAWVAQSAPELPTGLPVLAEIGRSAKLASLTAPTRDIASEAQPRAPPVVHGSARPSRVV